MHQNTAHRRNVAYSFSQPPPNTKAAMERLDQLVANIANIQTDLGSRTGVAFDTPEAFNSWKFNANRALGHILQEKKFISEWLNSPSETAEKGRKEDRQLNELVDRLLQSAPPYQAISPPGNRREISERVRHLNVLKRQYEQLMAKLKEETLKIGLPHDYKWAGRGKITAVIQEMEKEREQLKVIEHDLTPPPEVPTGLNVPLSPEARDKFDHQQIIRQVKRTLGMDWVGMAIWLFKLIREQKEKLSLGEAEQQTLSLIGQLVEIASENRDREKALVSA